MSHWGPGQPPADRFDAPRPYLPDDAAYPLDQTADANGGTWPTDGRASPGEDRSPVENWDDWDDEGTATYALPYEGDDFDAPDLPPESYHPWPPAPYPVGPSDAVPDRGAWTDSGGGGRRRGRRWLIPAGIVVAGAAVGATAVLLTSGHPASKGTGDFAAPPAARSTAPKTGAKATAKAAASPSATATAAAGAAAGAPLSLAQAKAVLAGYTAANNSANTQRSDTLLATVETGSSYTIDAALYQAQQGAGTAAYPAFSAVQATYYIPRSEPATGQRWFVVQVANAFSADPKKVTSNEYLLFTQSAPGRPWLNAIEPYLLPGANAPQITVGDDGLATAVSLGAASVKVAPGQLPAVTAASLDGTGQTIANPGNLADRADQQLWQAKVTGGTVTDTHTAAPGTNAQEYALLTTDGGALVFYTDAAELTITPPAGSALHLTVPGFYTPTQALTRATVSYLDQFAAYDPPTAAGTPRIIADYSAITGKN